MRQGGLVSLGAQPTALTRAVSESGAPWNCNQISSSIRESKSPDGSPRDKRTREDLPCKPLRVDEPRPRWRPPLHREVLQPISARRSTSDLARAVPSTFCSPACRHCTFLPAPERFLNVGAPILCSMLSSALFPAKSVTSAPQAALARRNRAFAGILTYLCRTVLGNK